jgi:D-xylose transport system permease protein
MTEPDPDTAPGAPAGESAAHLHDRPAASATATVPDPAAGAFSGDSGAANLKGSAQAYIAKVKGGEPGALPALLGVIVLVIVFANLSKQFLTVGNLANVPGQAGPTILIAMGLTFVLLLGEIDLSAGTAGGGGGALFGRAAPHQGHHGPAVKGGSYWAIIIVIVIGLGIAARNKLWPATGVILLGLIVALTHVGGHIWIALYLAIAAGTAIGCITGFLVARVGIPSFIVTLAFFLAWQGVIISFEGTGGAISMGNYYPVIALAHRNINPTGGWLILVVFVGGYAAFTLFRSIRRKQQQLSSEPIALVVLRIALLTVVDPDRRHAVGGAVDPGAAGGLDAVADQDPVRPVPVRGRRQRRGRAARRYRRPADADRGIRYLVDAGGDRRHRTRLL